MIVEHWFCRSDLCIAVVGSIVILAGHIFSSNFLDIVYTSGSKGLTKLHSKTLGPLELVYAFITLVVHKNSRSIIKLLHSWALCLCISRTSNKMWLRRHIMTVC